MPRFVHSPWTMVAVTFVALVTAAGFLSLPTIYVQPFEQGFGWTAGQIATAQALQIGLAGLMGPFAAASMERFGVRRTAMVALLVLSLASVAVTRVTAAWQLLPWAAAVGMSVGGIGLTLGATIANRWFKERRGLVIGLFSGGNATGQLVFLPLFAHIVGSAGWRVCGYVMAVVALLLIPIFVLVIRERPADVGLPPYGALEIEPPPSVRTNPLKRALSTLREAAQTRIFWLLAGSFAICGASTSGLIAANLVPACGDHGIVATRAASLLAMMGLFDLIGTTGSGWLSDRYDPRKLLFAYYSLRGLALLWLPSAFGAGLLGLPAFAVFYGLDWLATVPPTMRLATAAFGRERAPIVYGWLVTAHQLAASVTALATGWSRTSLGTYNNAFVTSGVLCMCGALIVLTIAARPHLEPRFATA